MTRAEAIAPDRETDLGASPDRRERLLSGSASPRDRLWGWLGPLLAMLIGGIARWVNLDRPATLMFDETYYVKQGWSLMLYGHEREVDDSIDDPDALFAAGNSDIWGSTPDMVVHPPVGKWMIGLGEWIWGVDDPTGWRLASFVVGTLSIVIVGRVAWHLFGNATLATAPAVLLAVDGHHFVHSRIGLLDVFLMFWVLCAFLALLKDRRQARERLWDRVQYLSPTGAAMRLGPRLGVRWWRILAGLCLGLALGTKWSGGFFLAVFGLMTVLWDVNARRTAGVRHHWRAGLWRDGPAAFVSMVPLALATYVASWSGWFLSDDGYKRQWAQDNPASGWAGLVPDSLRSLISYHQEALSFHTGLANEHAWSSDPWSWVLQVRPTLFYSEWPNEGEMGCSVDNCVSYVASLGNLVFWWVAAVALLVVALRWILRRDWRAGAALSGVVAGWLPWFLFPDRTVYAFYSVAFEPWLALTVTVVLAMALGGKDASPRRRRWATIAVWVYLALAVLWFVWFYPIHTGEVISREQWEWRLWFDFWI